MASAGSPKKVRAKKQVRRALMKKGFDERRQGRHRYYYHRAADGTRTGIRTMISHGRAGDDIDVSLLKQMAAQCGRLSLDRFIDLVDCTMEKEDFYEHVEKLPRR